MGDDLTGPVGLICPSCGEPPYMVMGDGTQAFCFTDDCPVLTWDPTKTRAQLAAGTKVVDLRSKEDPGA